MSVADLVAVCPPPQTPLNPPTAAHWSTLEAAVGHALPPDYKELAARYGSGSFGCYDDAGGFFDLAFFLNPGQPADKHGTNAIPLMMELTEAIGAIHARYPATVPTPAWPVPGGLLYVGGTTTQHSIYWKTDGAPEAWTCVVNDYGCDHWYAWNGDLTALLAAIATARVPEWITEGPTRFPLVFVDLGTLASTRLV